MNSWKVGRWIFGHTYIHSQKYYFEGKKQILFNIWFHMKLYKKKVIVNQNMLPLIWVASNSWAQHMYMSTLKRRGFYGEHFMMKKQWRVLLFHFVWKAFEKWDESETQTLHTRENKMSRILCRKLSFVLGI